MRYEKVYVGVGVWFLQDGGLRPFEIIWTDGTRYKIDKIKFIDRRLPKVGSLSSKRYTVMIHGVERHLFYESEIERWFVEKRII